MEKTKTKDITELLNELGIERSLDKQYQLLLWNDDVNDMMYIIIALFDVCGLNEQDAVSVMLEAHTNGKAVAKKGSKEEIEHMKKLLNDRKIEATVEQE